MLRWILAALAVPPLAIAIVAAQMHLSDVAQRPHSYDAASWELDRQIAAEYERVPLVALLAAPERYDGHHVVVSGFVTLEFEGSGLYLDAGEYRAALHQNALWLDHPKWLSPAAAKPIDRRYGEVAATFTAAEHGHGGLYSGALTDVRRIRPTYTRADFERWRLREHDQVLLQVSWLFLTVMGWVGLATLWLIARRRS